MMTGWIHDGAQWYYCGMDGRWLPSYGNAGPPKHQGGGGSSSGGGAGGGGTGGSVLSNVDILPDLSELHYDEAEATYYVGGELKELKGSLNALNTSVNLSVKLTKNHFDYLIIPLPIRKVWRLMKAMRIMTV